MTTSSLEVSPPTRKSANTLQIYAYFGLLTLLITFATPAGSLIDIPTSFTLKNQLHLSAATISHFRLITSIPIYLAFIFGLARDRWSPFGLRDRGQFLLFGPLTAAFLVWLAYSKPQTISLAIGILAAVLAFRMVAAAYDGIFSLIGQEKLMPGRISALINIVGTIPTILALYSSGWITEHLSHKQDYLLVAALSLSLGLFGLWKPKAVFAHTYDKPQAQHSTFWADVKRLLKHKAIYPAVGIYFLWNFAPAGGTALQFYLTNELHLNDSSFSNFNANFNIAGIPTFVLYGYLCKRIPQNKLLLWSTIIAVPQWLPIMFVHSALMAEYIAFPIGFMGGLATAAYVDLNIRSCPRGLQGTLMMLAAGLYALSGRGSDVLGTWIYAMSKENGFLYCAIATTLVYALMLPLLWLIPKGLVSTRDGEQNSEINAEA